ncbi:uncharacterized protein LOC144903456 [Branchiostoma floridae x Branchiostoma belcheri]
MSEEKVRIRKMAHEHRSERLSLSAGLAVCSLAVTVAVLLVSFLHSGGQARQDDVASLRERLASVEKELVYWREKSQDETTFLRERLTAMETKIQDGMWPGQNSVLDTENTDSLMTQPEGPKTSDSISAESEGRDAVRRMIMRSKRQAVDAPAANTGCMQGPPGPPGPAGIPGRDGRDCLHGPPGPAPCDCEGLDAGLLAHYPLDDSYADIRGNFDLVPQGGVSLQSGSDGNGYAQFGGAGRLVANGFTSHAWGSSLTVSVWFKRTGQFGTYQGIINTGYHASGSWEIRMGRENGGTMIGCGVVTSNSPQTWDYVHLTASRNTWHHAVMTYDGTLTKFYLDNVPQTGNDRCCSGPIIDKGNPLVIGQAGPGKSNEYFFGFIDEVRLYHRALCAEEVATLYQSTKPQ